MLCVRKRDYNQFRCYVMIFPLGGLRDCVNYKIVILVRFVKCFQGTAEILVDE